MLEKILILTLISIINKGIKNYLNAKKMCAYFGIYVSNERQHKGVRI